MNSLSMPNINFRGKKMLAKLTVVDLWPATINFVVLSVSAINVPSVGTQVSMS